MLDKYLKIFGLDNNFSLDELDGRYKELLKEFDTKNIEDDLKIIFLEEQQKISEAYQILLKFNHTREKVNSIKSKPKPQLTGKEMRQNQKEKAKKYIVSSLCFVLILGASGFVFKDNLKGWFNTSQKKVQIPVNETVTEPEPEPKIDLKVLEEEQPTVKEKCKTKVFKNKALSLTYKNWERWADKPEDTALTKRYNDEVKELEDLIKKYKKCRCPKCNKALEDGNLKLLIYDFLLI
jgi:hypothetical protein